MEIVVEIDSPTPLFNQLVEQIKKAVISEAIAEGAPLPSIRQLSNDLAINSKTVAKAYKILERDNVIEMKGYRGTFVHTNAKAHCDFNIHQWLVDKLEQAIDILKQSGATDSEIRIAFNEVMQLKQGEGNA